MPIAIVVHGGAGLIPPERRQAGREGCEVAVEIGWRILQEGGSALDAVEAAVRNLEDNPNFNAGTGSCLTVDGNIEMDAGMMDGHTLQVGAIAGIERIKNPITLARKVLESPHVMLIGRGAQRFAHEQGILECALEELLTERQYNNWLAAKTERGQSEPEEEGGEEPRFYRREVSSLAARQERRGARRQAAAEEAQEKKHGTVGAVALDASGRLAAATSTGGIANKYPGRVGDTPLIGCGFYADENAAVSCTGYGEDFARLLMAKRAADLVARGAVARDAAEAAIAFLGAKASGTGGLIVVDHLGNTGFAWNSETMSYAFRQAL